MKNEENSAIFYAYNLFEKKKSKTKKEKFPRKDFQRRRRRRLEKTSSRICLTN